MIIILILINKKVKFDIDFSVIGFEYNFCININYFFDIVTLYKEDFLKDKNKPKKNKESNKKLRDYKWLFKYFDVDLINIETKIGLIDVFATSMAIPVLSTVLGMYLQKYFSKSIKKFSIKPVYNELFFNLKGVTYGSIKLKDILYILFKLWFFNSYKFLKKKNKVNE